MSFDDPNEHITSATEILPRLWLGNQRSSQDPVLLRRVDLIVNCTKHIKFAQIPDKKHLHLRIPVNDPGNSDSVDMDQVKPTDDQAVMLKALSPVIETIARCRKRGMGVLVHCHAGMQRSAIVVAAYLIRYGYWVAPPGLSERQLRIAKMEKVVSLMVKKRPVTFNGGLSINFRPALLRFMKLK